MANRDIHSADPELTTVVLHGEDGEPLETRRVVRVPLTDIYQLPITPEDITE